MSKRKTQNCGKLLRQNRDIRNKIIYSGGVSGLDIAANSITEL